MKNNPIVQIALMVLVSVNEEIAPPTLNELRLYSEGDYETLLKFKAS